MLDHLFGLLLFGLGLTNPVTSPAVKGDSTELKVENTENSQASPDGTILTPTPLEREMIGGRQIRPRGSSNTAGTSSGGSATPVVSVTDAKESENIKKRESELKSVFEARKERVTEELKTRREDAVEKHKQDRATFKEQLGKIRDTKKQAAVTRIDSKVSEINKKRTDEMATRLTKMSEILDKVGVRSSEAKATGADITTVDALVTAARTAVTSAQTSVSTQAGKVYTANISSEATLGSAMSSTLDSLHTDLTATFDTVKAAHLTVQEAVKELKTIMKKPEPTQVAGGTN